MTTENRAAAPRRIVLTGFMGSGKTTVGPLVAARLAWRFVDVDDVIEAEAGATIAEIFARHGEAAFREREHAAGLDVLKPLPRVINRRRRDYLIVLIGGNLVFYFGLNAISGPAVGGLMAFFYTIGITWVMYGVMDKY